MKKMEFFDAVLDVTTKNIKSNFSCPDTLLYSMSQHVFSFFAFFLLLFLVYFYQFVLFSSRLSVELISLFVFDKNN